jgi:hypothetical protein
MMVFGSGKLIATPTNLADGTTIATPTPVELAQLQDVSVDMSVDIKTLYGSNQYPIAIGQGKGKVQVKAKYADIRSSVLASLFYGKATTTGIKAAKLDDAQTVPASSPFTITVAPPNSGTYVDNLGVVDSSTGKPMERVASAPATGQYSVSAGVYTFASADASKSIKISYEYSSTSSTGRVLTMTNQLMGYTPSFKILLQESFDGKTLVMKLNRAVSGKLNLPFKNDDFGLYDFEADAFADASGDLGYVCFVGE